MFKQLQSIARKAQEAIGSLASEDEEPSPVPGASAVTVDDQPDADSSDSSIEQPAREIRLKPLPSMVNRAMRPPREDDSLAWLLDEEGDESAGNDAMFDSGPGRYSDEDLFDSFENFSDEEFADYVDDAPAATPAADPEVVQSKILQLTAQLRNSSLVALATEASPPAVDNDDDATGADHTGNGASDNGNDHHPTDVPQNDAGTDMQAVDEYLLDQKNRTPFVPGVGTGEMQDSSVELATRPLTDKLPGNDRLHVRNHAQLSDLGKVRKVNQDAAFSFVTDSFSSQDCPPFAMFVLADGMGGHKNGEIASALAVRTIASQLLRNVYIPHVLYAGMDYNATQMTIAECIEDAFQKANAAIRTQLKAAGTTATAVIVMGTVAHIGHVGDSRAYVFHRDTHEQLTRDHSLVQRLIELDQLSVEDSLTHPQRNYLYRAVGQEGDLDVDTMIYRLKPGQKILLCCDGLWGAISDQRLKELVSSTQTPMDCLTSLINECVHEDGSDNITGILFEISIQK